MQVALAWLLQTFAQHPADPWHIFVEHLRENLEAATLQFLPEMIANLDSICGGHGQGLTAAMLQS